KPITRVSPSAGALGTYFANSLFKEKTKSAREGTIMARANWEGSIRLNLVSVPVRAYTASVTERGKIRFHLIHKGCNSRIHYKKVCPIHGEVDKDEIVSGYEYAKGEYIVIDPA